MVWIKKLGKSKVGKKNINGWIIVDKPTGITSTAVVNKIKWAFDAKKSRTRGYFRSKCHRHISNRSR